jgi:hypothetical protein
LTFKEHLQDYADEEDDIEEPEEDAAGDYQSPGPIDEDPVIINNEEVVNAILADKGITPPPKAVVEEKKKKYKRPCIAKISKFFLEGVRRRRRIRLPCNKAAQT